MPVNLNNFPQRFSENCRHPTWPASGPLSRCGDSCARPLPAWLRRRDLALSSGSDGDTSVLRGCFSTERLSSSFLKRKTGRTRAPTADPVGPHSSRGGRTLSWEEHLPPHPVLSPALPTHPGPASPPPLLGLSPEGLGMPPYGVNPWGLSALCQSTDYIRDRRTQGEFKYWSSTENLKGSRTCFEAIQEELALSGS